MIKNPGCGGHVRTRRADCLAALAVIAFTMPIVAQAEDLTFNCTGREGGPAEATAVLYKIDGQDKGSVTVDGTEISADVYPGLGSHIFVIIGEGYTMNYSVGMRDGAMNYSGTGSRSGFSQGTCVRG
jgi:hypothetical protein